MQSDRGGKPESWKLQYSLMSAIMGGIGARDVQTGRRCGSWGRFQKEMTYFKAKR